MKYFTHLILFVLVSSGDLSAQSDCDSLECTKAIVALSADGEVVVTADMFMLNFDPGCELEFMTLDSLGNEISSFSESQYVNCSWLLNDMVGNYMVEVREADTLNTCTTLLSVVDPLGACISDTADPFQELSVFMAGNFLNFVGALDQQVTLDIVDLSGRHLHNVNLGYPDRTYDLSFLPTAQMYIVTIRSATGNEALKFFK